MIGAELQHVVWLVLADFAFESSNLVRVRGWEIGHLGRPFFPFPQRRLCALGGITWLCRGRVGDDDDADDEDDDDDGDDVDVDRLCRDGNVRRYVWNT